MTICNLAHIINDYRYKIALDMTNALVYMHKNSVVHRDIKPSNVLLDDQFNARVGDFGLVKQVDTDRTSQSMSISGYISYMDPEYKATGKAGPASDIYSLGLVLLEMVSGERPAPPNTSGSTLLASSQLVEKVRVALHGPREAIQDVVDKRLRGVFIREQIERILQVGLMCVQFDHHQRPTSTKVMSYLTGKVPVVRHELQPTIRNSIGMLKSHAIKEFLLSGLQLIHKFLTFQCVNMLQRNSDTMKCLQQPVGFQFRTC